MRDKGASSLQLGLSGINLNTRWYSSSSCGHWVRITDYSIRSRQVSIWLGNTETSKISLRVRGWYLFNEKYHTYFLTCGGSKTSPLGQLTPAETVRDWIRDNSSREIMTSANSLSAQSYVWSTMRSGNPVQSIHQSNIVLDVTLPSLNPWLDMSLNRSTDKLITDFTIIKTH